MNFRYKKDKLLGGTTFKFFKDDSYNRISNGVKKIFIFFILILTVMPLLNLAAAAAPQLSFGVNFSRYKAESLKLDWQETYLAILNDLGVRRLRLVAYWPDIEAEAGVFDFSSLDWQIDQAEKNKAQIILAIGLRLPGWPECHLPAWATDLSKNQREEKILTLMSTVVNRYKSRPVIRAWQVENEPFFSRFGICPSLDRNFLVREIELVKFLDQRPIIITASGELSTWLPEANLADILGITIYRAVWNKYFKYFFHPWPALTYNLKGKLVRFLLGPKDIIVVELQAEPWAPSGDLLQTSLQNQSKTMNLKRFNNLLNYIKGTDIREFYFWGAEWWYWLKKQGDPSIWNAAKGLWKSP